jgi:electron-transferring-flavoprotein dehydrogenase
MISDGMITENANPAPQEEPVVEMERPAMEVDIACAGFGPAMGGFLTTLTRAWNENPADACFQSQAVPGMPLQVHCYERADNISAGVSGAVTRAMGIRASFPDLNPAEIPMAAEIHEERVLYLLDPLGASRRSVVLRLGDSLLRAAGRLLAVRDEAFELPWTPAFLHKRPGLVLSIGQFNEWVGAQLMEGGLVQIWPGTPVSAPIFSEGAVEGCDKPTRE